MMNRIVPYLRKTGCTLLAAAMLCGVLPSCDGVIYDYEGDCEASYLVKFRYDRNMKWADAFPNEVGSVHLYAFDRDGVLVWQGSEEGDALAAEGYAMRLGLPAGDYRLLAWCGLDSGGGLEESFTVPEARVGETRIEELQCRMNRRHDAEGACSDAQLCPLFHGMTDVSLPDLSYEGGEYTCTVPLTKNTNHVRVILQHLSGKEVNPGDFTFRIEEENGLLAHDNRLLPDEKVTYRAYRTSSGTAGLGIEDYPELGGSGQERMPASRALTGVSVAIADLSVSRLVADRRTYLTVETADGRTSARIPLTDYALLLKDGYDRPMGDQEYLDRQDEYALTFFLDEDRYWIGTSIIINSWKVVLDNVDFE